MTKTLRAFLFLAISIVSLIITFSLVHENTTQKITAYAVINDTNATVQESPIEDIIYSTKSYLIFIVMFTIISLLIISLVVRIFGPVLKHYT